MSADAFPHVAALGLGGNLGDPVGAMAKALRAIDQDEACRVAGVSRLYRTPPWGKTDQADFYNSCAVIATSRAPKTLLDLCLAIERDMKRVRLERWGPRTIDIDLLFYDDLELQQPELEIPHPRMLERGFVLMPLADIAADKRIRGKTVRQWLATVDRSGIVTASGDAHWWRGGTL